MQDIGRELREAREAKNLTLEQIANSTMISKKYLMALEEGKFEIFPGEVYLKGALRKYAGELNIDAQPLLSRYQAVIGQKDSHSPIPKEEVPARVFATPKAVKLPRPAKRLRVGRLLFYLFLLALIVSIILYADLLNISRRTPDADPPVNNGQEIPVDPAEPPGDTEEPSDDTKQPEIRLEADGQTPRLFSLYNAGQIEAQLQFNAACWVSVTADGSELIRETFAAGENRSVAAAGEMVIRFGYPRGAVLIVNGIAVELPQSTSATTITIRIAGEN
jgi:cytoskeleton protein RodZ